MKKMSFLVNPPKGARKAKRRRKNRPAVVARRRKRRRAHNPPAARRHYSRGSSMARRKQHRRRRNTPAAVNPPKRRRRYRSNPPRAHRRRSYRRNPAGLSVRGMTGAAVQGVKDAGGILAGEAVAGLVETYVPGITPGTTKSAAVAGVGGVVGGVVAMRFVGRRTGEMMIAGAIAKLVRRFVKAQNVPVLSAALGDYGLPLVSGYDGIGNYQPGGALPAGSVDGSLTGDSTLAEIYGY